MTRCQVPLGPRTIYNSADPSSPYQSHLWNPHDPSPLARWSTRVRGISARKAGLAVKYVGAVLQLINRCADGTHTTGPEGASLHAFRYLVTELRSMSPSITFHCEHTLFSTGSAGLA